ncbi:MAG TPA: FemAB family XrtA/PEP-CTERM system-associated protein [Gemmatimonadales bacterium]
MKVSAFEGDATQWDALVRAWPGWTPFHLYGWRGIQESVLGHECHYLVARDDVGQVAGLLPLVRVKSRLFGDYLVSMPFVNYGGPLGSVEAVRALGGRARELAERAGVGLLELRSRREQDVGLTVSHRKITVVLDLPPVGAEAVWKALPAKVRSQVRRPQKEGMVARFGPDQMEPFYGVFARHMRDLGTPVQSRRLFEAIRSGLGADVWFGCVYAGAKPVAAGCGIRWGTEFEMTWASALQEYNAAAPNMLLYWSFMERCAAEGVTLFNFGRCTPGSGTHRFKSQWGSRDEPLWWYQWSATGKAATPSPDDGAFSWGPRLWRHLPLAVANVLGPRIVRSIP